MTQPRGLDDDWVRNDDELLASLRDALNDPDALTAGTGSGARGDLGTDGGLGNGAVTGGDVLVGDVDAATMARMLAAAQAAFTWRTIDEELELLSATDVSELGLVRGAEEPIGRTLEFAGRSISIELEIGPDLIVGQIYPVQSAHLTLITQAGSDAELECDDVGCFTFPRPRLGAFRLRCTASDAGVITDWICMT